MSADGRAEADECQDPTLESEIEKLYAQRMNLWSEFEGANFLFFRRPSEAIGQIPLIEPCCGTSFYRKMAVENPIILDTFSEAAVPLFFDRDKLLKTARDNVLKLCADLKHLHLQEDFLRVELVSKYVKEKMALAKKEKEKAETLITGLLSGLDEQSTGYRAAERFFTHFKMRHDVMIDNILHWAEAMLTADDKREMYRIQKHLEISERAAPSRRKDHGNASGSQKQHLQGEAGCVKVEMELEQ